MNHRIAVEESIKTVKDYYVRLLTPLAKKWKFSIQGFGQTASANTSGIITVVDHDGLEPSPTSSPTNERFDWLTGTIRGVFGESVHVAPILLTGNTDTKFYWKLSDQIYRWSPWRGSLDPRGTMMHTVDERMPVEGLLEMVRFYHHFIVVLDEKRRSVEAWHLQMNLDCFLLPASRHEHCLSKIPLVFRTFNAYIECTKEADGMDLGSL